MTTNSSLKLITVNIEGDNHLERVLTFLQKERPDVICMQEVFASDVAMFQRELGMEAVFVPLGFVQKTAGNRLSPRGEWGLCILSKFPLTEVHKEYYVGSEDHLPELYDNPNTVNRILLSATVTKDQQDFTIATTHFTWTSDGQPNDSQRDHVKKLLDIVDTKKGVILCGDFNAPRGLEVFTILASRLKDNIPPDITTTIDQELHKVTGLMYVVDGIFSTPEYSVSDVRVIEGVSDHKAVVGIVTKSSS